MVTICLITHDNYWLSRYSIENLLQKAEIADMELFIVDNGSTDQRIIDYGKKVATYHIEQETISSNAFCYNEMFKKIESEWICIFPVGVMVNENWLFDLMAAAEQVENAGVAAIHAYGRKGSLHPLLTNSDEMRHVWSTIEGDISGVLLFNKSIIKGIGGFDLGLSKDSLAQRQFAFRVQRAGRHTFFIHEQSATDMMNRDGLINPEDILSYETNINGLKESKQYRIDL
jgi:hypothetical protein